MKSNIFIFIIFLYSLFATSCAKLGVGSYGDVEKYTINTSEEVVISAVKIFKLEHPELCPSVESKNIDGRITLSDGTYDYWYYVYFYYPDKKRFVMSWIRADGDNTTFALVSISSLDYKSPWLSVNVDLKDADNEAVKREFVERILNPINEILHKSK